MTTTSISSDLQLPLQAALQEAMSLLQNFANQADFESIVTSIFGGNDDRTNPDSALRNPFSIFEAFEQSDGRTSLPKLEVLSQIDLNGARAAFSSTTNTIYLAENFLAANVENTQAITSVLLEEIGHFIDSQLNSTDTPGDEGAVFAAMVQGQVLTQEVRSQLNTENDAINIVTPTGLIAAEASLASEANLQLISQSIDDALDAVLNTLGSSGLNNLALPLVGNFNLASYVSQFVNDTLKQGLVNELQAVGNASTAAVRQGLFQALGNSGLGLLLDSDGNNAIDLNDILLPDSPNSSEFKFKIGKTFNDSLDLSKNLGVAGLDLDVKGKANVNLGVSLDLHIGVDETIGNGAFFLKTSAADELKAQIGINLKDAAGNPLSFDGTLGFLNAKVTDNGTQFNAALNADLKTSSGDANRVRVGDFGALSMTKPVLSTGADLKFKIDTGISTNGTDKNGILPSIQADFEALNALNAKPTIAFKNVTLDAGSFVREFAGEVLESVQKVTEPIEGVIDTITSPLPVINTSLLELAKSFPVAGNPITPETEEFIEQITDVVKLVNAIPTGNQAGKIQLGDFQVTGANVINQTQAPGQSIADQLSNAGSFFKTYHDTGLNSSLAFPLLTDPSSAIKLLVGDPNLELFSYTTPKLNFGLDYKAPPIPIFGPITLTFGGGAGASAQLKFGFDAHGLEAFKAGGFNNPETIFDGFYASRPTPTTPNIGLYGELYAIAGVDIGFVSLGVGGGIRLSNNLSLYDANDPMEPFKVRGSDIATKSPTCLFQANGKLEAFIFAEFELDLGFFSISKRLNLADINLIDITADPDCPGQNQNEYDQSDPDKSSEVKALLKGQGIIAYEDIDGRNQIILEDEGGSKGKEEIHLILEEDSANETIDKYLDVKSILIEGRGGDDYIEFRDGVDAFGDVQGGDGNDIIITGSGNDYLNGGQGFDDLDGEGGKDYASYLDAPNGVVVSLDLGRATQDGYGTQDTLEDIENLEGSRFNDSLTGDDDENLLDGGAGNDTLNGLDGDDVFLSGAGADRMDGGDGEDTITFIGSRDHVYINLSNQTVATFSEFDNLPFSLTRNTGYGADADGDRFFNIENLQGSLYDDVLVAGAKGGIIDGYGGNDFIIAGAEDDDLVASSGIDWLSYRLSDEGVEFSLQTGDGSGGYADGDEIILPESKGQKFLERFEHLEGSNFVDSKLEGDNAANNIRGLAGNDVLIGLDGDDLLEGGTGADSLSGGNASWWRRANTDDINGGGDTATYQNANSGVAVNLQGLVAFGVGDGTRGEAAGDVLTGIENLVGSDYGDTLTGDVFDNDLNPRLSSGRYGEVAEVDTVDGGGGRDRLTLIDCDRNDEGIGLQGGFTNVATGSGQITRGADTINFLNIERLLIAGTGYDDVLMGGRDRDVLAMGAGNDFVNGGGGFDNLDGDDGIDTLSGDFSFVPGNLVLIGDAAKENQGTNLTGPGGLSIRRFEIFQDIITGDGNDLLIQLGRVDNTFETGNGSDTINAGLGIDIVRGGQNSDDTDLLVVDYSIGDTGSGITMQQDDGFYQLSRATADNAQIILDSIAFSGIDQLDITGTSKADQLLGTSGNDKLAGNAGDDRMDASYGNDIITGGEGDDFINPGTFGLDVVDGGTNTLVGDLLFIDYSGESTTEDTTGVISDIFNSNGSNAGRFYRQRGMGEFVSFVDEVKFTDIERFAIIGSDKSDNIRGGDGNDVLMDGQGNDLLTGGGGNDILMGGTPGNLLVGFASSFDILTGGTGADSFWMLGTNISNLTEVTDFNAAEGDLIHLTGSRNQYTFGTAPEAFQGVGIFNGALNDFNTLVGIVQGSNVTVQSVSASAVFN